ncbi:MULTISPECIES: ABC transporter permease [Cohnella]|uniref:ABC transporter permease subunit n=1 Tax=Cohnella hashimotonis TaxID=2826895 RepID=A0ABT6TF47_9BACL|nr:MULTISPECIES: ABC transporter permease subunit [Cohnella]MDI4644472.1 ABC transporter permease subunit [Cohnella hashimotonis]
MSFLRELHKNKSIYAMALPGLLFLLVFAYLPMVGHVIAFKKFSVSKGIWGSEWNGFNNFKFFFGSDDWIRVTLNTMGLNALFLVFGLGLAVILSIALNEIHARLYKKLAQSIIFLPYFVSWLVVSLMVFGLLNSTNGMINHELQSLHIGAIDWYSTPAYWPAILTVISIWKFAGYNSIIFLAAISGISDELYESARIDGANRLQQIFYITFPLLRPTLVILTLLAVGRIFYGDFGMIYGIVGENSLLYPTTDVIDTFTFRALRGLGDFGMASSVALYQSVMGLLTILLFNGLVKKYDPDSRLF